MVIFTLFNTDLNGGVVILELGDVLIHKQPSRKKIIIISQTSEISECGD